MALLAYSSNRTLSRHWVRQHLWSDRGNEQAQARLLKALQSLKAIDCRPFELIVNTQTAIRLGDHIELDTSGSSALFEDLDVSPALKETMITRAEHALRLGSDHAFVNPLVARVFLNISGEDSKGYELANKAVLLDPQKPYALKSAAAAQSILGAPKKAQILARES